MVRDIHLVNIERTHVSLPKIGDDKRLEGVKEGVR